MLLRRFYMSENSNGRSGSKPQLLALYLHDCMLTGFSAPNPKKKTTRVLKTDIPPPPTSSAPLSKVPSQVDMNSATTLSKQGLPIGSTMVSTPRGSTPVGPEAA